MPQKPHISISDLLASAAHAKRQNRWDDAREFALQALELEPGHVEASWYLKAVDDVIALVMYDRPIGPQLPSALENKMLKLLTEAGFKRPRVEYPLSGYRVDFAYPDSGATDGFQRG